MTINDLFSIKFSGTAFYLMVFIFGSCIGSFLNVVIYRLPIMLKNIAYNEAIDFMEDSANVNKATKKFNLSHPQSHCPRCKNNIPVWANVPILGFFFTKMRCHYCQLPISFRYPLVEAATALLFVAASITMPNILALIGACIYLSIFIALGLISYDKNQIPKSLSITLLWIGIFANTQDIFMIAIANSVIGTVLGFIVTVIFSYSVRINPDTNSHPFLNLDAAILASIIGAWFGYIIVAFALIIAFIIYSVAYLISKRQVSKFYLSVLICLMGIVSLFICV